MGWFTPWRWVFTSWRLVPNVDFKPNKTSTLWSFTTFSLPDLQRWGPPYNYKRSIWFHPRPYKWRNIIHETTGVVVTLWSFLRLYISDPLIQLGKPTTGPPWLAQKPKTHTKTETETDLFSRKAKQMKIGSIEPTREGLQPWRTMSFVYLDGHRIVSRRFGPGGGKPVEATFLDFIFFFWGGWWVQKKSKQTEQARIWLEVKFLQNEGVCEVFSCYY